jgi:dTDP-4-amino-4,6-dideoxygalactose transaminase
MKQINTIARKHNLVVIEDAAHAIGTMYYGKQAGTLGTMGCFSFHPIKNISTGDGGMIVTNKKAYADKLQLWRLHGMSKEAWKRNTKAGSWQYDILLPGYKYNMTDISAALGIHQIQKLEKFITKRAKIAAIYSKKLQGIPVTIPVQEENNIRHSWNLYTIQIDSARVNISRDELVDRLKERGIGTSVYFVPLHMFTYYKKHLPYRIGDFPVAEQVFKNIICLPIYPKMKLVDASYVSRTLKELLV